MKKLLILDLDETLLHATSKELSISPDFTCCQYNVYERPFVHEFLNYVFERFEVAVWTSSSEDYAECIVKELFFDPSLLQFVWARSRCTPQMNSLTGEILYEKNLKRD